MTSTSPAGALTRRRRAKRSSSLAASKALIMNGNEESVGGELVFLAELSGHTHGRSTGREITLILSFFTIDYNGQVSYPCTSKVALYIRQGQYTDQSVSKH
jgi:hypothetical protein